MSLNARIRFASCVGMGWILLLAAPCFSDEPENSNHSEDLSLSVQEVAPPSIDSQAIIIIDKARPLKEPFREKLLALLTEQQHVGGQTLTIEIYATEKDRPETPPLNREQISINLFTDTMMVAIQPNYFIDAAFSESDLKQAEAKLSKEFRSGNLEEGLLKTVVFLLEKLQSPLFEHQTVDEVLRERGLLPENATLTQPSKFKEWFWMFTSVFGIFFLFFAFQILARLEIHYSAAGFSKLNPLIQFFHEARSKIQKKSSYAKGSTPGGTIGKW